MAQERTRRIAPRREILILLPAALLLLVFLSTFTLLSYRSAVALLIEERQAEAAQLARQLAVELTAERHLPGPDALSRRLPQAAAVSIAGSGGEAAAEPAAPAASEVVVGTASFRRRDKDLKVIVELPAAQLRGRQRSIGILIPVLLTVNGAITVLVLLFLRRFLAPFERLIDKARHAGQEVPESQDEVLFLVETFEKALEALARPAGGAPPDDGLKALEGTLAKSLESGVLLLDAGGVVLALNEVGASLLEIEGQTAGQPVAALLERHPELATLLERAVRRGRPVQREECAVASSDHERVLGVTAHPLRRDDGALRGFLVIFADLTEVRKESRDRQLADSLSQLGELTAGVAHELRNSLATVRGYLALIDRGREGDSVADYLGEVRRETDHLKRVLEDFLTFARPGSARPQEVDLLGLVHRAASDPALGETAVAVDAAPDRGRKGAPAFRVWGDPQLLERAVRNVLSNAAEAQRGAGSTDPVRVRLAHSASGVEIAIEDRGPGLSPEARDKLFDPFFTQRADGVGLGLALTRRIVLLHSGRIAVEDREGGGTRAVLWIPCGKIVTDGDNSADRMPASIPDPSAQ